MKIIGIVLLIIGIYILFESIFIMSIIDGKYYDGLGILLDENGEHYLLSNIFLYVSSFLTFGIGLTLLSYKGET